MGRAASRPEHRGHFSIDLDAVEAVFTQAARQADRKQRHNGQRNKERFHVASSSGHHNQDVKQRKSPAKPGFLKALSLQYLIFIYFNVKTQRKAAHDLTVLHVGCKHSFYNNEKPASERQVLQQEKFPHEEVP